MSSGEVMSRHGVLVDLRSKMHIVEFLLALLAWLEIFVRVDITVPFLRQKDFYSQIQEIIRATLEDSLVYTAQTK